MILIRYKFGRNTIEFRTESDLEFDSFKECLEKFGINIVSIERLLEFK